jgi:hypothetical protein
MVLEAQTFGEHKMWLNGLIHFCPKASISGVRTDSLSSVQARLVAAPVDTDKGVESSGERDDANSADESLGRMKGSKHRNRDRDRDREKERRDRDDHRKTQSRHAGEPTTARLHEHIRRDEKEHQRNIENSQMDTVR